MTSGTSTGPSGTGFLVAMFRSYTRRASSASQAEAPSGPGSEAVAAVPGALPAPRATALPAGRTVVKWGPFSQEVSLMRLAWLVVAWTIVSYNVASVPIDAGEASTLARDYDRALRDRFGISETASVR
jgi:hypothetical protein